MLKRQATSRRQESHWLAAVVVMASLSRAPAAAAQDDTSEDLTEDLTETIPAESDTTEPIEVIEPYDGGTPPPAKSEPVDELSPSRVQLSGYARESLELVYGELSPSARASDPVATSGRAPYLWRDVFLSRTQLVLRASYIESRHFEATVSGMLGYTLHVARQAPLFSVGVVDLTRGELESQLRDAYLAFFWPAIDLRVGQQRVAWGKTDFQSPNDVLNARDLRDPFLAETELRHLPTPLVRSSISGGPVTFEAVIAPLFVPDRYDVYGSNWAAIQRGARDEYEQFLGAASLLVDPTVERDLAALWRQTARPPDNGKGIAAGARFSLNLPGADVSAYYHYGYDSTPRIRMSQEFLNYLDGSEFAFTREDGRTAPLVNAAQFQPVLQQIDGVAQGLPLPFDARYIRRHHVGLDMAATLGPLVLRIDTAFQTRRTFYRATDLNTFVAPTVLGVVGLEYQTGSLDDVILVELLGARLLRDPDTPLLGYERTTTAVAGTLRWTLSESWGADLRGLVGIRPVTYALQPALRFKANDALTIKLGALIVSGATASLGGYYEDNDTAYLQLRYAF